MDAMRKNTSLQFTTTGCALHHMKISISIKFLLGLCTLSRLYRSWIHLSIQIHVFCGLFLNDLAVNYEDWIYLFYPSIEFRLSVVDLSLYNENKRKRRFNRAYLLVYLCNFLRCDVYIYFSFFKNIHEFMNRGHVGHIFPT